MDHSTGIARAPHAAFGQGVIAAELKTLGPDVHWTEAERGLHQRRLQGG